MTDEQAKELATTIRKGDTFKHAGKTHTAEKVSQSAGEVWVEVKLGESGTHKLVLKADQRVEVIARAEPEPLPDPQPPTE